MHAYINSLEVATVAQNGSKRFSNEHSLSKKLLYLLHSKLDSIDGLKVIDINQEIVSAHNYLSKKHVEQEKNGMSIREKVFARYKLQNNRLDPSKFALPQAFVERELRTFVGKAQQS